MVLPRRNEKESINNFLDLTAANYGYKPYSRPNMFPDLPTHRFPIQLNPIVASNTCSVILQVTNN